MNEYVTVSSSSYDPASLATKLTEKSAEGWTVVAIVPTGGDVTAFLSRSSSAAAGSTEAESAAPAAEMHEITPEPVAAAAEPEPAVSEPAGWAVAPEPVASTPSTSSAPATVIATPMAQIGGTASYGQQRQQQQQQQAAAAQPAPATAPAAVATPSVPAGWYADPAGRFELRYWDGGAWTEHVSTGGQQTTNPPTA